MTFAYWSQWDKSDLDSWQGKDLVEEDDTEMEQDCCPRCSGSGCNYCPYDGMVMKEATIEQTLFAINHLKGLIKGNKEVLEVLKLFPSEKKLCKDLKETISGKSKYLKD